MSELALDAARMMDMLPEDEKLSTYNLIKKIVLAWDPDFTKVTPEEKKEILSAEKDEFIDSESIDWNNLSKY